MSCSAAQHSCRGKAAYPPAASWLRCKTAFPAPVTHRCLQGYGRKKFKGTVTAVLEPEPGVNFFNIE